MKARGLAAADEAAIEELLRRDDVANLFLLAVLREQKLPHRQWYGAVEGGRVLAAALVLPGRLVVPAGEERGCAAIGRLIRGRHAPSMLVGPRAACDALWRRWAPGVATRCHYDQRLYVARAPIPGPRLEGFRRARPADVAQVAVNALRMEEEDLQRSPGSVNRSAHAAGVLQRIKSGRTWVVERGGEIRFQINVGTRTTWGCQVGGTFVPAEHRGRGLATRAMRELGRRLLPDARMITLHVNEANRAAVRVYERSGYERHAPFRLITLP